MKFKPYLRYKIWEKIAQFFNLPYRIIWGRKVIISRLFKNGGRLTIKLLFPYTYYSNHCGNCYKGIRRYGYCRKCLNEMGVPQYFICESCKDRCADQVIYPRRELGVALIDMKNPSKSHFECAECACDWAYHENSMKHA